MDVSVSNKANIGSELLFLRNSIDNIDSAIISILFHRANIINNIIEYKKIHNLPVERSQIREENIRELVSFGATLGLSDSFVKAIFENLFEENANFCKSDTQKMIFDFFISKEDMLKQLNTSLKHLDLSLCSLLSERMQLVKQVGEYKKINNIQPLAQARWEEVLKTKARMSESFGINPEASKKFYNLIHEEALKIEANS